MTIVSSRVVRRGVWCLALGFAGACGFGDGVAPGGPDGGARADAVSPPGEDGGAVRPAPDDGSPRVFIHLRATTTPVPHDDGLAGQTPLEHRGGIRRFEMLTAAGDPAPVTVIDYGDGYVDCGLDGGDDTLVGSIRTADVPPGHYTVGRTVWTHVRYRVVATMHYMGLAVPGELDNLVAMSDRVELEGTPRAHGWYRYVFRTAGMDYPLEGSGLEFLPAVSSGGFTVRLEAGEAVYDYPIDLEVADPGASVRMVMEVDMHESFRWQDQSLPGYATGVLDVTPTSYEPVLRFGANAYRVYRE